MLTLYGTTFALVHAAAAAQISFRSENRSSRLRYLMVLQHACFLGWMCVPLIEEGGQFIWNVTVAMAIVSGIYWYGMGALLTSEWPHLSRRVQRDLPQSQLGRTLLTWFNPGPGSGFMFCVANLTMILVLGLLLLLYNPAPGPRRMSVDQAIWFLVLGWSYVVLFLGAGRLTISFLRRFTFVSLTAGFLVHGVLVLVACGAPFIVAYMSSSLRFSNQYSLLHLSNPIWTLQIVLDQGVGSLDVLTAMAVIGGATGIVLLLNIRMLGNDVREQRRSLPARVAEEEAELHAAPLPGPANPWDESPPGATS